MRDSLDAKTAAVARLIQRYHPLSIRTLLVVGCGSGVEAATLACELGCAVYGLDIKDAFDSSAKTCAILQVGDAKNLPYNDASFDFVYSYHALEHIDEPLVALAEMRRVVKAGGGFWIGTPNRTRIVGYVGSKQASLAQKIQWNYADWKKRLSGRFRNECGAHAGFTLAELKEMLLSVFSSCEGASEEYYEELYPGGRPLIRALERLRVAQFAYPSVYFVGRR